MTGVQNSLRSYCAHLANPDFRKFQVGISTYLGVGEKKIP